MHNIFALLCESLYHLVLGLCYHKSSIHHPSIHPSIRPKTKLHFRLTAFTHFTYRKYFKHPTSHCKTIFTVINDSFNSRTCKKPNFP